MKNKTRSNNNENLPQNPMNWRKKMQINRIQFFSWGKLRIEERRRKQGLLRRKAFHFPISRHDKNRKKRTLFLPDRRDNVRLLRCQLGRVLKHFIMKMSSLKKPICPVWSKMQLCCRGCKSFARIFCADTGVRGKKRKKLLTNHSVYSSGAEHWVPAEQNNLMTLLSFFPYCLLKTKYSVSGQAKINPTSFRSFFPKLS